MHAFRRFTQVSPYSRLAPLYDRVMDHVDYDGWADYIVSLFATYKREPRRIVDGGCGTGTMALALERRGYDVVGFDRSEEMIRIARSKVSVPFWQGDLKAIGLSGTWDAFLCLYDTLQYLESTSLDAVCSEVWSVLADAGLFVFDVVTEAHVLRYWADYTERDRGNGWEIMRKSWYDRRKRCQHTEFHIVLSATQKDFRESHQQRIYALDDLEHIVRGNGFKLLGRLDGFTTQPADETSDRVHFVLQKEES
jgi:SAM-dependent methyltransferase